MQCKYCGKEVSQTDVCGNCYRKRKKVRELVQICQIIKEKAKNGRGGNKACGR